MRHRLLVLTLPVVLGLASPTSAAEAPPVRELRVQKVGDVTYFHVRFETPRRMFSEDPANNRWNVSPWAAEEAVVEPRLVPQDGLAVAVCRRTAQANNQPSPGTPGADAPTPVAVEGLEFVGKLKEIGEAKFLLLYPTESQVPGFDRLRRVRRGLVPPTAWVEVPVTLDFAKAKDVAVPKEAAERKKPRPEGKQPRPGDPPPNPNLTPPPVRDDLEGLWAVARVDQFERLGVRVDEFGYYSFAAQATARKYGVPNQDQSEQRPLPAQPRRSRW